MRAAAPLLIVLTGLLLFLPTLDDGFFLDDYYHLAHLEEHPRLPAVGPLSIYTFADGRTNRMDAVQGDVLPWWSAAGLRIDFFRPLTSLLHRADHALYGRSPVGYHVTNLLLWGGLLLVLVLFYRRLGGPVVVLVAGLFYAVDEAHIFNIQWVAARHGLLGSLFCVAALIQYHRFRQGAKIPALVGSLLFVLLGLLSSEVAVGVLFYVIAYELCLSRGGTSERLGAAAPVLVLVVGYLVYYLMAGHGARESAYYLSPLDRPGDFILQTVGVRIPYLMMGALSTVAADLSLLPSLQGAGWPLLMAWGSFALFGLLLLPHLKNNRVSRFMVLGAFLSLLPQASAWPQNRLLILPTIGFAWALGAAVVDYANRFQKKLPRRRLFLAAAAVLVIVHGLVAPVQSVIFTGGTARWIRSMDQSAKTAEMPAGPDAEKARVLLLNGPEHGIYLPVIRWAHGHSWPAALWVISVADADHRLLRTGERSFLLEVGPPGMLSGPWELLLRKDTDLHVGERFPVGALRVEIEDMLDGEIRGIEVTVDLPLDSPDVWLLGWTGDGWARHPAPAVGGSLDLGPPSVRGE
jgi:hypothetical protein